MPIRRKKYHGLYFHSSAPRVVTMMKARAQDNGTTREAIVIKPSNIRIWIHDKDIGKLTQVLWEGQGNRLRTEMCSNKSVRKFLDAVPYVMNVIKETHAAVIDNNLNELINITSPPVPKGLLASKDVNGLTPLHKAAGLNYLAIVDYILRTNPATATELDATGKSPLHWASSLEIYNKLVQAGADELACDYRMKTANYYRTIKPNELNKSFLTVIPEAPRVAQSGLPSNYDWSMFDGENNYQFVKNSFARKSQSTYGSFNTLNGGDDRNHGSAEVISSAMRDDESEENDAEMLNDSGGTSATTAPANDDNDDDAAVDDANKMDQNDADNHETANENLDSAERIDDDVEVFDPSSNELNQEQLERIQNDDAMGDGEQNQTENVEENQKIEANANEEITEPPQQQQQQPEQQQQQEQQEEKPSDEPIQNHVQEIREEEKEEQQQKQEENHIQAIEDQVMAHNDDIPNEITNVDVPPNQNPDQTDDHEIDDGQDEDVDDNETNIQNDIDDSPPNHIDDDIGSRDEDAQSEVKSTVASITQSPRVDERIDSAANREILIIDHGDGDNVADFVSQQMEDTPDEVEPEDEPEHEIAEEESAPDQNQQIDETESMPEPEQILENEIENIAPPLDDQPMDYEENHEENDNHITTIETSEIENFNEIDDIPDLEYESEMPMDSVTEMQHNSIVETETIDRHSAQSIKSVRSAGNHTDQSKPSTPGSALRIVSAKTIATNKSATVSEQMSIENNSQSAKSRKSIKSVERASANSIKSRTSKMSVDDDDDNNNNNNIQQNENATNGDENVDVTAENEQNGNGEHIEVEAIEVEPEQPEIESTESVAPAEHENELTNGVNEHDEEEAQQQQPPQEEEKGEEQQQEQNVELESNENQELNANDVDNISRKSAQINGNHRENGTAIIHQEDANDDLNHNKEIINPSVMEIKGIVQGEADNNVVQSASRFSAVDDEDNKNYRLVQEIIEKQDMEQLAAMVLNGDGQYMIGAKASQPEIQAFIENVPAYMNKIRRVHLAAREGSLRDLQSALDRRKFAVARDDCSPGKCTPIHVATIFGHASILRYLGGRFPETTSAVDDSQRTALHYAATIKDNGHFYNLLVHLGSNPKAADKFGNTTEFYLDHEKSEKVLSHAELLRRFGVTDTAANQMLNDQVPDDSHSARREIDDSDVLNTLERCYCIIQDATKVPTNNNNNNMSASSMAKPPIDGVGGAGTRKTLPNSVPGSATSLRQAPKVFVARFLRRSVFDRIKTRQTRIDHNLFDVIWPAMKKRATLSSNPEFELSADGGVVAPDFDVFVVFQEFLVPLIKDLHCIDVNSDFNPHPETPRYFPANKRNPEQLALNETVDTYTSNEIANINLDKNGRYIRGCVIECCRNLDKFELPLNLTVGQLEQVERIITTKLLSIDFSRTIDEKELGVYYTMNEVLENPSEIRSILEAKGLLIPLLSNDDPYQRAESIAINGRYWPYGRGVFVSSGYDFVAWINCQEHLRILCCTNNSGSGAMGAGNVGRAYVKMGKAIMYLTEQIEFRYSYFLGYLAARPSFLGTSLRITLSLELSHLIKEPDNLQHLCNVRGLRMALNTNPNSMEVRVSNLQALSIIEWKLFQDFCTAVTNIMQLEKDLSMESNNHIATMLMNIFRKKQKSFETDIH